MTTDLKEGEDFYFNAEGKMVLTGNFLLSRGYCCSNGCIHCPYKQTEKEETTN